MTSIGKLIVLFITIANVFLLGISASALVTGKDWKGELAKLGAQAKVAQDETDRIKKESELRLASLNDYEAKRQSQEAEYQKKKIEPVIQEAGKLIKDNEAARVAVSELRQKADASLAESKNLAVQVIQLRQEIVSLEEQKTAFDQQNQDIEDQIRNLERQIGVAQTHQTDLGGARVAAAPAFNLP